MSSSYMWSISLEATFPLFLSLPGTSPVPRSLKEARILSISSLSEPSWSFLFTLMAHCSALSLISVVLENCKSHFHVGFHCLGLLLKKVSLVWLVGVPFGSSLLIWLSWKSALAERSWTRGVTKTFPVWEKQSLDVRFSLYAVNVVG